MSLHAKIIWLFFGIAVVPLLVFAAVARHQTLSMVDQLTEVQLQSSARIARGVLEEEAAEAESALRVIAGLAPPDTLVDALAEAWESGAGPRPDGFHYLAVENGEQVISSLGAPSSEDGSCADRGRASSVRLEVPLERTDGVLVGAYRPGSGAGFPFGERIWVFDRDGELILSTTCDPGPGPTRHVGAELEPQLERNEGGGGAFASLGIASRGWTVVVEPSRELRAPLSAVFRSYWVFVLGLAATTLFGFAIALRPVTRSLLDLTQAAERVAAGDLQPWFPPPREDEVGRLTHAFQDMTDRLRATMSQVERSSRLAVLGQLSAYLAHEIRNPLSAVQMNLQRLQRWRHAGEIPDRCGEAIDISLKEVGRLSGAISNILQLSPSKAKPRDIVAMHELVREVGQLLGADFERREVDLTWDLAAESDRVLGEPGQLKGVFINLMLNALDAQPDGGDLTIASELLPGGQHVSGPQVVLRFRDRGPGVPSEIRPRIFEPFFTTRESGSGIGLAVASQTVRDHGGEIYLADATQVNAGAEFVVTLPLAAMVLGDREQAVPRMAHWLEDPVAARGPDADD